MSEYEVIKSAVSQVETGGRPLRDLEWCEWSASVAYQHNEIDKSQMQELVKEINDIYGKRR